METYLKDFSIGHGVLTSSNDELEELISARQTRQERTAEYTEAKEAINEAIENFKNSEAGIRAVNNLQDAILDMETICYSAAYRDGIADIIAAMTFNKLGITKADYICRSSNDKGAAS